MGMLGTGVDFHLLQLLAAQTVVGQHALDSIDDDPVRVLLTQFFQGSGLGAAGVSTVAKVGLLLFFVSGDPDLGGIRDDDKITVIQMGYKSRFMFSTEDLCDPTGEATQSLSISINFPPVPLNLTCFYIIRFQFSPFFSFSSDPNGSKKAA